jgi:methionyl-tRNA synthetase
MAAKRFYITTTLPYVNSDPHIGFALEIVQADIQARYHSLMGNEVFFNTGTDEHGLKIYRKATEEEKDPQKYTDEYAAKFRGLKEKLNLYPELHFIRTTDAAHKLAAQKFWNLCLAAGDIYKKNYQVKYCVGCELEKTESELVDGKCPIHPNLTIELINEENYFFRWSKYQKPLLEMYKKRPDFVVPDFRFNEIKAFVERGLEDFSISRQKEKMPWGVEVPGDESHVMYVWFDALVNYISTLGWGGGENTAENSAENFEKFWGTVKKPNAIQLAGKDNLRQQSAMWQAMLMSAGLPSSKQIVIHGFITSGGQKMSKSLGNVVDPYAIVDEYGVDALRYFLARHVSPFEDSDFTMERFKKAYNADLANGLGNLTARIMTLAEANLPEPIKKPKEGKFDKSLASAIEFYEYNKALEIVWAEIQKLDQKINETTPFKLIKTDQKAGRKLITELVIELYSIVCMLEPFLPYTHKIIKDAILANKKPTNLFPRKD